MKKVISILLVLMILSTSFASANPNATVRMVMDGKTINFQVVQLRVDGKAVATDVPSVIYGSRTLVPIHVVRNMGIAVEWKDTTREVTIKTNDKTVVMKIDSPVAIINGEAKRLPSDVPPKIITYQNSGRTMVPIAFLRELGLIVGWNETTKTVSVEKPIVVVPNPPVNNPIITKAVKDVTANFETGSPEIRIKTGEELSYTELKLADPARLVFDFQDTKFDLTNKSKLQANGILQLNVNSFGIKSVRASQFKVDPFVTRITVELDEMVSHQVYYDEKTGDMVIQLDHNTAEAFRYWATSQTASKLAFRSDETTQFNFSVSDFGRTLHVSVSKDHIELPIVNLAIDDLLLESINIGESQNGDMYHVEIRLKENINYQANSPAGTKEFIIEFTTKQNNTIPLIIIDPGHGGTDPGATSPINSLMEKHVVLDISQKLNKLLTDAGFRTYMTRTADNAISLADRVGVANQLQADLFVSVHANAAASSSAHGVENIYYPSENNPNDARDNKKLAQVFQKEMVRVLGANNRGIVPRENLYVIRETKMPAVLTEVGFLTNPQEAAKLATPEYRQLVAEAIYQSILKYFEEIK